MVRTLTIVLGAGGMLLATIGGAAERASEPSLNLQVMDLVGSQVLALGQDKYLHYTSSRALTLTGPGSDTQFVGNLRDLFYTLYVGLDKELKDRNLEDTRRAELREILSRIDLQLLQLEAFILKNQLDQEDLMADQIGATLGISLNAVHQLPRPR